MTSVTIQPLPFTTVFCRSVSLATIAAEAASIEALAVGGVAAAIVVAGIFADHPILKFDAFDIDLPFSFVPHCARSFRCRLANARTLSGESLPNQSWPAIPTVTDAGFIPATNVV